MSAAASAWTERYGPWAVVTGASDGIGKAFAHELARSGLNLVLVARQRQVLEALAGDLSQAYGVACRVHAADLSQRGEAQALIDATRRLEVGLLVAAAGFGTSGPLLDANLAVETNMLDLNCGAVLALAHHFGGSMAERGRGGVVFLSSLLAFHGTPGAAHYAATKAYVQSLAEGLRVEWSPLGVDVIAAAPGPTRSGFAARADLRMTQAGTPEAVARGTLRALGRRGTVRPGGLSKLLGWSLATLPRWLQVRVIGAVMQGMTAHQEPARLARRRPTGEKTLW